MTALVAVETVLLVLLVVLVAGLLRSHAEILRRLGQADALGDRPEAAPGVAPPPGVAPAPGVAAGPRGARGVAPPSRAPRTAAQLVPAAVSGSTPDGGALTLAFDGGGSSPTLLAFLTSGCSTCARFWETLGEPRLPSGVQTVVVARGAERERPVRLRSLAPEGVPVVMSSQAWEDYGVPGAPYFVLVDGIVRGEGVATTWQALASLVSDAIEDRREAESVDSGTRRARRVDETLAAAGIGPEHPSLHPGRRSSEG